MLQQTIDWLDSTTSASRSAPSLEPESLLQRQPVLDLRPRQPEDVEGFDFEPHPSEVLPVPDAGVQIEWAAATTWRLRVPVDLLAAEATAVEIETRGLRGRPLELRWRTAEGTAPTLPLTDYSPRDLDGGAERYRFVLRGVEAWRGRIVELEFLSASPVSKLSLYRIGVWSERLDAEQVSRWQDRPLQVDLGGDARQALLAIPGSRLTRLVTRPITTRTELRAAVAVPAWSAPARFRVTATGHPTPLWQQQLTAADGWRDVRVPLEALAGSSDEPLELTLEMDAPPGSEAHAAGFWAHPAVYATPSPSTSAPRQSLNVILISIDTLRADHLSLYGYERPTSPNLDQWARRHAVVFDNAIAASPWTLPSHVSMFSGLDAHRHGVNLASEHVPSGLPLLAEQLQQAGYTTQAITGGGYLHPNFGLSRGFDAFRYWNDRRREAVDDELSTHAAYAREWLQANVDRPFFLFFHTYAVHGPLRAHEPFYQRFGGKRKRNEVQIDSLPKDAESGFVARSVATWYVEGSRHGTPVGPDVLGPFYDSGIAAMDRALGPTLRSLDSLGLSERTVVLITSDHGEMLGEHGVYNHLYLYDENLRVPFVLAAPNELGAKPGHRVETQVRSVDIVPTLLDLLDLPIPDDLDGVSLVPLLRGQQQDVPAAWSYAASSNYGIAVQDGRNKVIHATSVWPHADTLGDKIGQEDVRHLDPEAVHSLQRQLQRGFLRDASGLRLRFQNPGDTNSTQDFSGRFKLGPFLPTNGLESTDLESDCPDGPCVQRGQRNTQDFRVPAGTSYTLIAEVDVTRVEIWATLAGSAEHHLRLDVENLSTLRAARLGPEGWQLLARLLHPDEVGVLLWWDGHPASREAAGAEGVAGELPAELPAELEAQLRALGYLQ